PANLINASFQHRVTHSRPRPDGVEERLFGHQLASMGDKVRQHRKGFGTQCQHLLAPPEAGVGSVEPKWTKGPLRGRRHGPLLSYQGMGRLPQCYQKNTKMLRLGYDFVLLAP